MQEVVAQWKQYATPAGNDHIDKALPVTLEVRGVEYRTIRHPYKMGESIYTVAAVEKLLDTIRPGEWGVRMWGDADPLVPDEEFNLDGAFIGDGKLLALSTTVGGPWGGGVNLVRADVLALCEDNDLAERKVISSILRLDYDIVDLVSRLLGYT